MRIRNNNALDLEGNNLEQITVQVASSGTVFGVTTRLNGTSSVFANPFIFTLDRTVRDPFVLTMFFVFSNPSGGIYDVTITGSAGGSVSQHTVSQMFGEPDNAIAYTFNII